MSDAVALTRAGLAVVRRDLQIAMSYRFRFYTTLLGGFFSLTLFYYISRLVRVASFESNDAYYAYVVIGLIILQVLNSTLQTPPATLRQELVAGTFERIVVSPFGPTATIATMLVFPFLYALLTSLGMLIFASTVFGVHVEWSTVPLAIPTAALSAAAFAPFGLMVLGVVLVVKQAVSGTTWIVAGLALVSGLYFPPTLLPDWIQWASDVQPFAPSVDLMRHLLVGTPLNDPLWLDLARLIGFAVLLMPVGFWVVRLMVRQSRRRGTIIEY